MGGEGFAFPAGTCSLMKPMIFFAMLLSYWVQTDTVFTVPSPLFASQIKTAQAFST
jgi:hypothetical protein